LPRASRRESPILVSGSPGSRPQGACGAAAPSSRFPAQPRAIPADAVDRSAALRRDDPELEIALHERRIALERIAVAAPALPRVQHHVPGHELEFGHLRLEPLQLPAEALEIERRQQVLEVERKLALRDQAAHVGAADDQLAVADPRPPAELSERDGHLDAVRGQ